MQVMSSLDKSGRDEFKAVAKAVKNEPNISSITIQGRTDPTGGRKHNRELAKKRAKTIMAGLINQGISRKQIDVLVSDHCCDGDQHAKASVLKEQRRTDVDILINTNRTE